MRSIAAQIMKQVNTRPPGEPFSTHEFMGLGNRAAIDQAFSRMTRAGHISRITRGVYVRPKISAYVGEVPPEAYKVAQTIAKQTGSQVQVSGAEAARRLGLSTQVPTTSIFYTNGPSRKVAFGNTTIFLKKVSPRKMALAGRPAGLALTALWYLGKETVTSETIRKIQSQLSKKEFEALSTSLGFMPGWMHDAFIKFRKDESHG